MTAHLRAICLAVVLVLTSVGSGPSLVTAQDSGEVVGSPDLTFGSSADELVPGATTELSIGVTNREFLRRAGPERFESRVTTARGLTLTVADDDVPIDVEAGQVTVGNLPTGSTSTDPLSVSVSSDAEPGTYEVPIEYQYQYTHIAKYDGGEVEYRDSTKTDTGTLTVEVSDRPRFEIVSRNSSAQVGETGDVAVTLRNSGSQAAADASVSVTAGSRAITFDAGAESATAAVGRWEPGETRTATFAASVARGATERNYTADLNVSYADSDGIERTAPALDLSIPVGGEQTFAFEDVTADLHVGEDGTVSGTVTNTGPSGVESVVVQYADNGSSVVPIESAAAVGSLEPGASGSFELPLEVVSEARSGSKSLSFAATYRTQDGDRGRYGNLDVVADVEPERDRFSIAVQNRSIEAGAERTISVAITSQLDERAEDVQARLFADDPLASGETDEAYVPAIDPGGTVNVTYQLSAASSATPAKTYPISFDVRYDDQRGNSHLTETLRVPIDVTEGSGGLPLTTMLLVVLSIGGLGGLVWYRRN